MATLRQRRAGLDVTKDGLSKFDGNTFNGIVTQVRETMRTRKGCRPRHRCGRPCRFIWFVHAGVLHVADDADHAGPGAIGAAALAEGFRFRLPPLLREESPVPRPGIDDCRQIRGSRVSGVHEFSAIKRPSSSVRPSTGKSWGVTAHPQRAAGCVWPGGVRKHLEVEVVAVAHAVGRTPVGKGHAGHAWKSPRNPARHFAPEGPDATRGSRVY